MYLRSFRVKALSSLFEFELFEILSCWDIFASRRRASVASRQRGSVTSRQRGSVTSRQRGSVASRQRGSVASRQRGSVASRQRGSVASRQRGIVLRQGYVTSRMSPRFCPSTICHPRLGRSLTLLYILTIF